MLFSIRNISFATLAAIAPGLAAAQDWQGAATIGYGNANLSDGGGDIGVLTLDAIGTVDFNNGVFWGVDAKYTHADPDDFAGSESILDLGTTLNYQWDNGAVLGAYLDYADEETDTGLGFDLSGSATSYGISAGYVVEGAGFEAWIGETTTSPSLPSGIDWTDYGALFRYQATESAAFGMHYVRSEISGFGASLAMSSYGLGGYYQFAQGWGAYAGITRQSISDFDADATTFGVGVDYSLAQVTDFPAQVSLELARTDFEASGASADLDTIRLGLTFPLGQRGTATPLNSVARAAMAPRHNALSTLLDSAF